MANLPRYYWDSSCYLAWLKPEPDRVDGCREVIRAGERGEVQIVSSTISLTEVIKLNKGPIAIPKEAEEKISSFFKQEYIVIVQLTRFIAEQARALIWTYPALRPKDAIHAATAIYGKIETLHTFDVDFLPLDSVIGDPKLRIKQPSMPQGDLPLEAPPGQSEAEDEQAELPDIN
jgi:predicted nucleic acid-binding protein